MYILLLIKILLKYHNTSFRLLNNKSQINLVVCSYLGICIQPILGLLNLKYEASKLLRLEKECEDADLRWVVLAF